MRSLGSWAGAAHACCLCSSAGACHGCLGSSGGACHCLGSSAHACCLGSSAGTAPACCLCSSAGACHACCLGSSGGACHGCLGSSAGPVHASWLVRGERGGNPLCSASTSPGRRCCGGRGQPSAVDALSTCRKVACNAFCRKALASSPPWMAQAMHAVRSRHKGQTPQYGVLPCHCTISGRASAGGSVPGPPASATLVIP